MLDIQTLNTKVLQHFFTTLYKDKLKEFDLVIMQDRQSTARPVDATGMLKTYLFYRVESPQTVQWQTKVLLDDESGESGELIERTVSQKDLHVTVNFLGKNAATAASYFDHAINSSYAEEALRPTIDGRVVEFQYNNHTQPVDLTEIEQSKWVARYEYEIVLGYVDVQDFPIDVFDDVLVTEQVVAESIPAKPIVIQIKEQEV